ncbi:MAG: AAA family ATPase [Alphaproteobacteria bacterium]|nr:AAA family ATPase [Alphaproteobacteria bacterium]
MTHRVPTLFSFAGLPGSGKSTLSQALARRLRAPWLRIDTVEQGLRDLCGIRVEGEGYRLSYRIAADNLRLGLDVVADSCNPIALTRREWRDVATSAGAACVEVEVVCSDPEEHRRRVEGRQSTVPDLILPTWQQVVDRAYDAWDEPPIRIDTAGATVEESVAELLRALGRFSPSGP